jgi:hypothetical protein
MKNTMCVLSLLLSSACSQSFARQSSTPIEFVPQPITRVRAPLSIAFVREHITSNAGQVRLSEDGFDTRKISSSITEISPIGIAPLETVDYPLESLDATWGLSKPYVRATMVERNELEKRFIECNDAITLIQMQCKRNNSCQLQEIYEIARRDCERFLNVSLGAQPNLN